MAKIGLNLAVRGICCQILEFLLANTVGEFKFDQSSRPLKDLEPMLNSCTKCNIVCSYFSLKSERKIKRRNLKPLAERIFDDYKLGNPSFTEELVVVWIQCSLETLLLRR